MYPKVECRTNSSQPKSAITRQESSLPKIVVTKHCRWTKDHLRPAEALAALAQLIGLITRVAIDVAQLFTERSHAKMQDVALQGPDFARHAHMRMDFLVFKASHVAPKQAQVIFGI